jgi:hypothetical protein
MSHIEGCCSVCGAACGTGYQAFVNAAYPTTPAPVGGPSHPAGKIQKGEPVPARREKRVPKRRVTPQSELVEFAKRTLNEAQFIVFVSRLERHHGYRSRSNSMSQRLADLVHWRLDDPTAQKYLDELRHRADHGDPLIQG